jgi:hypothetical protein
MMLQLQVCHEGGWSRIVNFVMEFATLLLKFCEASIGGGELCVELCYHLLHHAHELGFFIWSHEEIVRIEERACATLNGPRKWKRGFA